MNRFLVSLMSLLVCACLPDVDAIRWDPLDIDALREQLDNPTGEVTEDTANEVAAGIINNRSAYLGISSYLERVFDKSGSDRRWTTTGQRVEGTSVFAVRACPGADLDATDVGFAHGSMRLDSPSLTVERVKNLDVEGDLLLTFVDCRIGKFVFNGVIPAHLDRVRNELGVGLDVNTLVVGSGDLGVEVSLDAPVIIGLVTRVLFTLDSSETLTLELDPLALQVELTGTNGSLICEIIGAKFECTAP